MAALVAVHEEEYCLFKAFARLGGGTGVHFGGFRGGSGSDGTRERGIECQQSIRCNRSIDSHTPLKVVWFEDS